MRSPLVTGGKNSTADRPLPPALADAAEPDTPDEVHAQRVVVTRNTHWYDHRPVLHTMEVTS